MRDKWTAEQNLEEENGSKGHSIKEWMIVQRLSACWEVSVNILVQKKTEGKDREWRNTEWVIRHFTIMC